MTKSEYAAERLDPRWQKMRLRVLERDGFQCQCCYQEDKTLHVHHSYYARGRKCWDYPMWSLSTVCEDCHKWLHEEEDEGASKQTWVETGVDLIFENGPMQWELHSLFAKIAEMRAAGHGSALDILRNINADLERTCPNEAGS